LGRVTAEDVRRASDDEVVLPRGTLIDEKIAAQLEEAGVDEVKVRSVIACESTFGVCAKCYGRDLARGHLVNPGESVGVMAALGRVTAEDVRRASDDEVVLPRGTLIDEKIAAQL
ncbi:hypothetical protein, partial [Staphylococcus aureus]|uniref:hypothetical protein n=1 Tax=Staphylococcus aureus TaxID=1280 RepID=UPI001C839F57